MVDAIFNSGPVQMLAGFIKKAIALTGALGFGKDEEEQEGEEQISGEGVKARVRQELLRRLR